jgi:hypothetical protein
MTLILKEMLTHRSISPESALATTRGLSESVSKPAE